MNTYINNKNIDDIYEYVSHSKLMPIDKNKWQELIECGIIDPHTTYLQIMKRKEKKVLEAHAFKISHLSDGRVGTWIFDDNRPNHRRNIKATDYDQMIDKLYDFYCLDEINEKALRLCDIFDEWVIYKTRKKNNKPETKRQNIASYNKYVKDTPIDLMSLNKLKTIDLEEWAIQTLLDNKMTSKKFNTVKIVVTGTLAYAKRKGYITENPWIKEELEYVHLFKRERIKASAAMIFYPDEIEILLAEFERGYALNENIANLALMINFDLGLRVGELAALKWTDINWKNETIFIQRQEDSTKEVVDYVKSDSEAGYRELDLSDDVLGILKRIKLRTILSEFVFSNIDGSRAPKMQFEHRLTKAEIAIGFESGKFKYTHCIRRTVASRMNIAGFSLEETRRWLGHTNKETTLKYIYNPYRQSETKKRFKECSILGNNSSINYDLKTNLKTLVN